jgi:hypothetical protein
MILFKKFILIGFLFVTNLSFAQSWHAEKTDGTRYQLSKTSTGVYTLKLKSPYGTVCISKLIVNKTLYDNAYAMEVFRNSKKDEYCTEKITEGKCEPWTSKVILSWYEKPDCFMSYAVMALVLDDGFDIEKIVFYEDK